MKLIKYIAILTCVFCIGVLCGCEPLESMLPNTTGTPIWDHTATPLPTNTPTTPPAATPQMSPSPDILPDESPLLPDYNLTPAPDISPDTTQLPNEDEARNNPTYPSR